MTSKSTALIIETLEKSQMKESLPEFNVGDTIIVHKYIVEGQKKRIQKFEGICVRKEGIRSRETFTVRKVIDKVGVEKTYLTHSPLVDKIEVTRKGKVRRARLNYLRNRIGAKQHKVKAKETR